MKKLILPLLLILSTPLFSAETVIGGRWGGLHNSDTSISINDNEAQDLQNVEVTQDQAGLKKIGGYSTFKTIGVSTWGVRGGYYFRDAAGVDTLIHANGTCVYKSTNSLNYVAFITTTTNGAYWDFTDSLGFLYGANSSNDNIWRYNGTTLTWYPSHPKGNQIEFTPDRMVISGEVANPNRVYFAKVADPTNFTVGNLDADSFWVDYGLPGQKVTAIKWSNGRLLIFTKSTLAYWYGTTQYDGILKDISTKVGTVQPNSVINYNNMTYFQGNDKHFYVTDGDSVKRISNELYVDNIGGSNNKSWTTDTQAEFGQGTFQIGLSSLTLSGSIQKTAQIDCTDIYDQTYLPSASTNQAQSFRPENTFILTYGKIKLQGFNTTTTSTITIRNDNADTVGNTIYSTATFITKIGTYEQLLTFSPPVALTADTTYWLNISTPGSNFSISFFEGIDNYRRGRAIGFTGIGDDIYFRLSNSSSTYQSSSNNVGTTILNWNTVVINDVITNGSVTYAIYGDTNTTFDYTNSATFTSSQTITNGQVPSIAVAPYVGWTSLFNANSSTASMSLSDLSINWQETGTPIQSWSTIEKEERLIFSVAEGTASTNSACYMYDTRLVGSSISPWFKFNFPMDAPVFYNDIIYFGGVSTGVVYNYPSGNTFDGSAITAYWKSKDFLSGSPFTEKKYTSYSMISKTQTGSNLDIDFTVNTSSTISNNYSLTDPNGLSLRRFNYILPVRVGTFFNIKFGNNDADAPFEVYTIKYDYEMIPWRVMQ